MTFSKADGRATNTHYFDIDAARKGYKTNCVACSAVFEARLRGYDIEALPSMRGSKVEALSKEPFSAWVTKDGKQASPTFIKSKDTGDLYDYLLKTVKSNERYILQYAPFCNKGRCHVVTILASDDNKLYLYDAQRALLFCDTDIKKVFNKIDYNKGQAILKVSELDFVYNVMNCIAR